MLKYFMQRSILRDLNKGNKFPHDYPLFLAFTSEDLTRVRRDFVEATVNGLSPDFRKICATKRCDEGYSVRELMEAIDGVPEVSEEEYNMFVEVPHWNPFRQLSNGLGAYASSVKQAREESKKEGSDDILLELTQKYVEATSSTIDRSHEGLPDGEYSRE